MLTLTAPPEAMDILTEGSLWSGCVRSFWARIERLYGSPISCFWVLEYTTCRRQPHLRAALRIPSELIPLPKRSGQPRIPLPFGAVAGWAWAEAVGLPPEARGRHQGLGASVRIFDEDYTSQEIVRYFAKHAAYFEGQQRPRPRWVENGTVPKSWGHRRMQRVSREVEVSPEAAVLFHRLMRRYARSKRSTRRVRARRGDRWRWQTRRSTLNRRSSWLAVDDGERIGTLLLEAALKMEGAA